ncbi:alpha/beta hydrolase [Cellulomonas xiejunii]|uniref:alpha/beta hydrolase n=1 Tax=Cellulomonas xiejunii TaxID=2968083 RepID=UPI001D0E9AA2|nr:alpha/beta hydrolase family protein [Cellulomonas xiejunii]MCC2314995.1 esterase family protein [Cellulomonas xiejunii]
MALLTCHFFSEALGVSTAVTVLLPESARGQIGMGGVETTGPPPVLYLLHGLSDDETIWLRRTSIERYVAERGIAVVMPRAGRSFYADEAHGSAYWTFLSEELPRAVQHFFRVSDRREDTFVAGLSMGGYGAFKWALRQPWRFAAAASLSGALVVGGERARYLRDELMPHVWGGADPAGTDDDLLALLDRADPASLPALYATCGAQDELVDTQHAFVERAAARGVAVDAHLHPGGHDWAYWDEHVQRVLDWLPMRG